MTTFSARTACHAWPAALPLVRLFDPDQTTRGRCEDYFFAVEWGCCSSSTLDEFFSTTQAAPDCALLACQQDLASGVALASRCRRQWPQASIILLAEGLTVSAAVDAMRNGVDGILEFPADGMSLREEITKACVRAKARAEAFQERYRARAQIEKLGTSELEVLRLVSSGVPNKNIAMRLNVAIRTVEKYRHSLFDALGVSSAAEATRLFVLANLPSHL